MTHMKQITAIILSMLATFAHADSWSTPDKPKHFAASIAWGAGARMICPTCTGLQATALGTLPGLIKEIQDSTKRNGSGWSNRDLLADIAGAYVGVKLTGLIVTRSNGTTTVSYAREF
jgi:uncharacterized protein YfiM (DUF2279 family)